MSKVQLISQNGLQFDEPTHIYKDKDGKILISVSQLLEKYSEPFDKTGEILINSAKKKGVTPEELRKEWDKAKVDGLRRGTIFHKSIEYFIETGEIKDDENKDIVLKFKDNFKFKGKPFCEQRLFSEKFGIAGTTDLVELFDDNSLHLRDWKTNRELSTYSFNKKMLYPINYLYSSTFLKYELQLNIYALMLEEHGYWVNNLALYHVDLKTREITVHPVKNRRRDVIKLLNHYNGIREPKRNVFRLNQ